MLIGLWNTTALIFKLSIQGDWDSLQTAWFVLFGEEGLSFINKLITYDIRRLIVAILFTVGLYCFFYPSTESHRLKPVVKKASLTTFLHKWWMRLTGPKSRTE